jgi:preprotein translocase subunit YajC
MDLLFPLLIVFMIGMIFFSNRQRKKQAAKQESLQNAISVGDVVVMTSGISGTVVDTDDEKTIDLEIAPDVITTWLRAAVREKLAGDADLLVGDVDHLGEAHTVGPVDHEVITDAPVDHTAPPHTTGATNDTATHGTAAPAAGSDGASAEPSFSDPTATPNGNGVSAGSSNPGDPRSSS